MVSEVPVPQNFNSQPHKEADGPHPPLRNIYTNFNSQPHKEADLKYAVVEYRAVYFNSQPHKEADKIGKNKKCYS